MNSVNANVIECSACRQTLRAFFKDLRPVITRLKKEGRANMAICSPAAVAGEAEYLEKLVKVHLRKPCSECGAADWEILHELRPIIIKLKRLGACNMANAAPPAVAIEAGKLYNLLNAAIHLAR